MKASMAILILLFTPLTMLLATPQGSCFEVTLVPNQSIEAGNQNVLFNFTVTNTNQTYNITEVYILFPPGFALLDGSNLTSALNTSFSSGSASARWTNETAYGILENLSSEWFVFNSSVPDSAGSYNFTINVYSMNDTSWYSLNQSLIFVNLTDDTPPPLDFAPPTDANSTVIQSRNWTFINVSSNGTLDACLLDNGTANVSMSVEGSSCWYNLTGQNNNTEAYYWVWANDSSGNLNRTGDINLTFSYINCSLALRLEIVLPSGEGSLWGEPLHVEGFITDACGYPVENAAVNWTFSRGQDSWTGEQNMSNQSQGWYNFSWTETQNQTGYYNISMNATNAGYPQNQTLQEDAFFLALAPDILSAGRTITSICPDEFDIWARVTDADSNYVNLTLEISLLNQTSGSRGPWRLVDYSWQDQLTSTYIHFYPNFTNLSFGPGVYSYRFNATDEFGFTDIENGSESIEIHNCSRVFDIIPVSPAPQNGSSWYSRAFTINLSFSSPWYGLTQCWLNYSNGTSGTLAGNASPGYCEFSFSGQPYGSFNYSLRVGNSYTNDSWNGTWEFELVCTEDWSYGPWSECSGGSQSRSATDLNSCGTADNRSALTRSCDDGGGGGGSGIFVSPYPTASESFLKLLPEEPEVMEVDDPDIPVTSVTIEVNVSEQDVTSLEIVSYSSRPSRVSEPPNASVQSYLGITSTINSSRLSRVLIEFSVERDWLNQTDPDSVVLMRLLNETWTGLPTIRIESQEVVHRYRAVSPGLSYFAIAVPNITNQTAEAPQDGFSTGQKPEEDTGAGETDEEPPSGEDLCQPGESQCVAGIVRQVCNKWGTGWVSKETCIYGCRDGECSTTFVLEFDINQVLVTLMVIILFVAAIAIFMKRKAIEEFMFWRL